MFVQKSKMAAAVILNYNFVMLDNARSPFVHLKFPFKFRVDKVRTFRDIAIQIFRKFGLKCLFRPQKIMFWGSVDHKHYFLLSRPPNRNRSVLVKAYIAYVRPILEYGSVVCSPYKTGDISCIEQVQPSFTKRLPGLPVGCY